VIGGAPTGSAAARLLARLGHDVVVVPGRSRRGVSLAESLPPSCRKPLEAIGMLDSVVDGGFVQTRGNSSSWADEELRSVDFGESTGFQVVRELLDRLLLDGAAAAGAHVLHGASASDVSLPPDQGTGSEVSVRWRADGEEGEINAPWLLDCSGRAGVLARDGSRIPHAGPSTIALVGVWSSPGEWNLSDPSHTIVEAYEDGWSWSVPVAGGRRYVAVMADPRHSRLSLGMGLEETYARELRKTRHIARLLEGARLEGRPFGSVATPYSAERYGGDGYLLVGDAGSFIDPLSSFGVKKALASGWLAAVVAHTALRSPEMRSAAVGLYEERERAVQVAYAELARRHYVSASERFGTRFWAERSSGDGNAGGHGDISEVAGSQPDWTAAGEGPPSTLPIEGGDGRLKEALERIRNASPLRLRAAPGLRRVRRPTVEGYSVVLEDHLIAAATPGGIRYHQKVSLPILVDLAPDHQEVPDLYESYCKVAAPVGLPEFLSALAGLVALRLVEQIGDD
jgi:flavin-dependent dehydrogenase